MTEKNLQSQARKIINSWAVVSFLADFCYEGLRSLAIWLLLKAQWSDYQVGLILTGGQLWSLAWRWIIGRHVLNRQNTWVWVFWGYGLTAISAFGLALAPTKFLSPLWLWLERWAKGVRGGPKDLLMAEIVGWVGAGKGFGWHDFWDQMGAVLAPLIIAALMSKNFSIPLILSGLGIAAVLSFIALIFTWRQHQVFQKWLSEISNSKNLENLEKSSSFKNPLLLSLKSAPVRVLWSVLVFWGLIFPSWEVFGSQIYEPTQAWTLVAIYAGVMALEAVSSIFLGWIFDHFPLKTWFIWILMGLSWPFFQLLGWKNLSIVSLGLFQGGLATLMKATIASLKPSSYHRIALVDWPIFWGLLQWVNAWGFGLVWKIYPQWVTVIWVIGTALSLIQVKKLPLKSQTHSSQSTQMPPDPNSPQTDPHMS